MLYKFRNQNTDSLIADFVWLVAELSDLQTPQFEAKGAISMFFGKRVSIPWIGTRKVRRICDQEMS